MMKRLPPVEKIYEAYSAIADGRVEMPGNEFTCDSPSMARVTSSDGTKVYTVSWEDNIYSSNDNGTYWQGYPGYPVLATLMLQGRLPLDMATAEMFAGINWKELNSKHKGDYAKAAAEAMASRNYNQSAIDTIIQGVYARLETLPIIIRRGSLRPPK